MDTQCPGDGAPLHRGEHRVSSRVIIFGQGEKDKGGEPAKNLSVMLRKTDCKSVWKYIEG